MITRLPDLKVGKGKEFLAVCVLHGVWVRDTITSSSTVTLFPPLCWGLEPWSNAHVLKEVICWATVYQNHKKKKSSIFSHGSVVISLLSFAIAVFKALLKQTAIQCHHMKDDKPHSSHMSGSSSSIRDEGPGLDIRWLLTSHWNRHIDGKLEDWILDWMLAQEGVLYLICKFKMATGTCFPQLQFISTNQLSSHAKKSELSKVKQKCN